MSKKVVIEIDVDGSTSIDAQGFTGNSCAIATRELELVLSGGAGASDDKKKPDYYATNPQGNTQHN